MPRMIPDKNLTSDPDNPDGSDGASGSYPTGKARTQGKVGQAKVDGQKRALRKLKGGSASASPSGFPRPAANVVGRAGGPKGAPAMADTKQRGSSVPATPDGSADAPYVE